MAKAGGHAPPCSLVRRRDGRRRDGRRRFPGRGVHDSRRRPRLGAERQTDCAPLGARSGTVGAFGRPSGAASRSRDLRVPPAVRDRRRGRRADVRFGAARAARWPAAARDRRVRARHARAARGCAVAGTRQLRLLRRRPLRRRGVCDRRARLPRARLGVRSPGLPARRNRGQRLDRRAACRPLVHSPARRAARLARPRHGLLASRACGDGARSRPSAQGRAAAAAPRRRAVAPVSGVFDLQRAELPAILAGRLDGRISAYNLSAVLLHSNSAAAELARRDMLPSIAGTFVWDAHTFTPFDFGSLHADPVWQESPVARPTSSNGT